MASDCRTRLNETRPSVMDVPNEALMYLTALIWEFPLDVAERPLWTWINPNDTFRGCLNGNLIDIRTSMRGLLDVPYQLG